MFRYSKKYEDASDQYAIRGEIIAKSDHYYYIWSEINLPRREIQRIASIFDDWVQSHLHLDEYDHDCLVIGSKYLVEWWKTIIKDKESFELDISLQSF